MKTFIKTSLSRYNAKFWSTNTLKYKCLVCIILLSNYDLSAQPTIEWEKNYGGTDHDFAYSIQKTINGGYIVAGSSRSNDGDVGGNHGSEDYWIVKLDGLGNLEWEKNYGGTEADRALFIQQTTDQGYIAIGWSESNDGDVGGNYGGWDYWIIKLDSLGSLEWEKNYGGSGSDYGYTIQQTAEGGYIGVGFTYSNNWNVGENYGGSDYWIVKLDALGNLEWEKNYGGTDGDRAYSVQQTIDGGYTVVGHSSSNDGDVSGNNGYSDYWILKLDELGSIEWEKNYGGSNGDEAYTFKQTTDRGYIVAGKSSSSDGDVGGNYGGLDNWIIKLDELGNLEWENNFGGMWQETSNSVQQTIDGGYIIAGHSHFLESFIDSWIIKLDEQGDLEWKKNYGGVQWDEAESILQTVEGDYIVAGRSESRDGDVGENNGENDFWIKKLIDNDCGCTDPYACNYNPTATCDDNSCLQNCNETFVYPGDLNHDGIVNNQDVGLSGLYLNQAGYARDQKHQNTEWNPYPSQDWELYNNLNIDLKHHDCNGDGLIDENDEQAIRDNMGEMWSTPEPGEPPEESDYQVMLHPIDQIYDGNLVMNVALERRAGGDLNLQGGHFTVDYSDVEGDFSDVALNFQPISWLGTPTIDLWYESTPFHDEKKIEVGFTKTDYVESEGKGVIGQLILRYDNSAFKKGGNSKSSYQFEISTIGIHQNNGNFIPVEDQRLQVNLNSTCQPNWTIDEETPFQNLYESSGNITTNGFVIVGKGQEIEYKANRISMNTGFSVRAGADFKVAYNNTCETSLNCDPLFDDYPGLSNYINTNTCTNEVVEEYYDGSNYYFLYIQNANQGELYLYNNGTLIHYGTDAGDASLPIVYGTATGRIWTCGF